jgi:hypothetical protein
MIEAASVKTKNNADGASNNNNGFPCQLYQMLEDAEVQGFDHIVSWLPCGTALKVHSQKDFEKKKIMSRYFKQTRYKSFQKQLNLYRFQRTVGGAKKGAYSHELFRRGQKDLCKRMARPRLNSNKDYVSSETGFFNNKDTNKVMEEEVLVAEGFYPAASRGRASLPTNSPSHTSSITASRNATGHNDNNPMPNSPKGPLTMNQTQDDIINEIILTFGKNQEQEKNQSLGTDLFRPFYDEF